MFSKIHPSWNRFFDNEKKQPYFQHLLQSIENRFENSIVFPKKENVFRVFESDWNEINVVIIGQDPYPTFGYANGLSFSVNPNIYPYPKSLLHIFREIKLEYPAFEPENGDLNRWMFQGVFLLNTLLTVEKGLPLSHKNIGWEIFTKKVIEYVNSNCQNIVYLLWGKNAHTIDKQLNNNQSLIIKTSHPSPLGYTKSGVDFVAFKNSGQFKQCNDYLISNNKPQILW